MLDAGVRTDSLEGPLEEMHDMDRVREEVEAFNKACDLPDSPDDDEDEDEGFEDDQLFCD